MLGRLELAQIGVHLMQLLMIGWRANDVSVVDVAAPRLVVGDAKIGMDDDGARTKLLGNEADTAWMSAAKSLVDMPTPS